MLLGIQIAMFVAGIMYLARGKGLGKKSIPHPQYRWLGGFLLTALPITIVSGFVYAFVWSVTHLDQTPEQMNQAMFLPVMLMEVGIVALYAIIASVWENSIRRKASLNVSGQTEK